MKGKTLTLKDRTLHTRYAAGEGAEGPRFIEVTTTHDKARRRYRSYATVIEVSVPAEGYSLVHWQNDWPYAALFSTNCARYSERDLQSEHFFAQQVFESGMMPEGDGVTMHGMVEVEEGVPA